MFRTIRRIAGGSLLLIGSALLAQGCQDDGGGVVDPGAATLTVALSGIGSGTVTSQPAGIACAPDGGTCSAEFEVGTDVTLTAAPGAGMAFVGWTGGCTGSAACSVTIDAATTVGAAFDDPDMAVESVGPAGGNVTSRDGLLTLSIPAGALTADQEISVERIEASELAAEWDEMASVGALSAYELGPDGLVFDSPITVALVSDQTVVQEDGSFEIAGEFLFASDGGSVEALDSVRVGPVANGDTIVVSGEMSHFSTLARADLGGAVLMYVTGIPDELEVGDSFDAIVHVSAQLVAVEQAFAVAAYLSPLDTDFGADYGDARDGSLFRIGLMTELGANEFETSVTYTCTDAGIGATAVHTMLDLSEEQGLLAAPTGNDTVTMFVRKEVNCVEPTLATLTVTLSGTGTGGVISDPAGIECTSAGGTCTAQFALNSQVELVATADEGSTFEGWGGDGSGNGDAAFISVLMEADKTVDAAFGEVQTVVHDLSVVILGATGTITSAPAGIDCTKTGDTTSGTCSAGFDEGTQVTLTADVPAGSVFESWTGDGSTDTDGNRVVTMDAPKAVTATVAEAAPPEPGFMPMPSLLDLAEGLQAIFFPGYPDGSPNPTSPFLAAGDAYCPDVIVAGTGGAAVVNSCTGALVQDFTGGDFADDVYFDALFLPVAEGQTGDPAVLFSGQGYFLCALDPTGAPLDYCQSDINNAFRPDANAIGNDAANGAVMINGTMNAVDMVRRDAGSGGLVVHADVGNLSALSQVSVYGEFRSAMTNATGDKLLLLTTYAVYFVELDPADPGADALTVRMSFGVRDSPRRVRCDLASELCAISYFGAYPSTRSVFIFRWDGETAPDLPAGLAWSLIDGDDGLANGPVGIDVFENRIVTAGFDDNQYSIVEVDLSNPDLAAGDSIPYTFTTTPLPAGCEQPGHAVFLRDVYNSILASCNASSGIALVPEAF